MLEFEDMKVNLIVASSLDGYIAQREDQVSTAWTSSADKKYFGRRSKEMGIMIMGRTTYETMGRPLPGRISVVMTRQRELLAQSNLERDLPRWDGAGLGMSLTEMIGRTKLDQVPFYTRLEPVEVLKALAEKSWPSCAICGGAKVYQQFLNEGLVDEIEITMEPVFLGGGIKLLGEEEGETRRLELVGVEVLEETTTVLKLRPI